MSAYFVSSRMVPKGTLSPIAQEIFGAYEQGVVYDPSDMSTLFQDSAGTVPVTAVEQPVGLMLDKSGRGNHAAQATTTKRPVLSRRVNLLNKTVEGAPWSACVKTEISNYFGEDVGFSLYQDGAYYGDAPFLHSPVTVPAGTKLTATALVDMSTVIGAAASVTLLGFYQGGAVAARAVLTKAGVVSVGYNSNVTEIEVAASLLYGSVYRLSVSARLSSTPTGLRLYCEAANKASAVWGRPQLCYSVDAHLPYQRVNTATDYDADPAKFPAYLRFDGVDDALQTANINFTSTDKMTAWAGVLAEPNGSYGFIAEFGPTSDSTSGTFSFMAPHASANITAVVCGTSALSRQVPSTFPGNYVITSSNNLAGGTRATALALRINSMDYPDAGGVGASAGGGVFSNYPLYIGARAGTHYYFNGRLYSLIVRGAQSSLSQIEATEFYIKQKMRLP